MKAVWTDQQEKDFDAWLWQHHQPSFWKFHIWARGQGRDSSFLFWRNLQKTRILKTGSIYVSIPEYLGLIPVKAES